MVLMNNSHSVLQREWSKGKRRCPAALPCCALKLPCSCIIYTFISVINVHYKNNTNWSFLSCLNYSAFLPFNESLFQPKLDCCLVLEKRVKAIVDTSRRTSTASPFNSLSCRSGLECPGWLTLASWEYEFGFLVRPCVFVVFWPF